MINLNNFYTCRFKHNLISPILGARYYSAGGNMKGYTVKSSYDMTYEELEKSSCLAHQRPLRVYSH